MLRQIPATALFAAGVICSSSASPVSKLVTFTVAPGTTTEVGLIRPIPSPSGFIDGVIDTRSYTGSFSAKLVFDIDSLVPQNFTFNSGSIIGSGYDLQLFTNVIYASPYGVKSTFYFQQAGQISYAPTTSPTPGLVDFDGSLIPSQQRFLASQGIIVTGRSVTGSQVNRITDDYINFPDSLPLPGSAKLTISQVSKTRYSRTLKAKLVITIDDEETILLPVPTNPALNSSIIKTEVGSITSNTTNFTVPTAFGQWSTSNKLTNPDPETLNAFGIPYAILMALNLPVTAATLPITIENTEYGSIVTLDLPADGLENPMSAEYATDLTDPDWAPLPTSHYLHGADSLDYGKNGSPTFSFPSGHAGFIRFVSVVE